MVSQVAEMPSVNEVIVHCQKQIKKDPPEDKLLHYLGRLTRLRITTQDLVETGIGRTVNQLSRHDGEVGSAARKLVRQWKAMVAEESKCSGSDSNSGSSSNEEEEEEEEDAEGDGDGDEEGDGGAPFVEKEVNSRHSDEDASSHNDQQSVNEAMEEDGNDHDSDVSDRLCIDDEVPATQPLHPQMKEKVLLSSSSESDSDSDGQEDADENHKGSSSDSEHEEISSGYDHIKQEPIINNGSYDESEMHTNNHLENQLKYEPKSSASSSRHSEEEYSDSSSHSPKRKAVPAFPKEATVVDTNVIHKSRSTPNESETVSVKKSEKKYDSSEDEKYRKRSTNSKPGDKHSKEKSNGSKSTEKDKDKNTNHSKAVVVKKEPMDVDEEYEPEKPKYSSNREKVKSYSEKSKHRDKDGEKAKRVDRESDKSRSSNKDSERSKHHDKEREKDRDRSKRHEKSDKSKYNDNEKSKHSSQHKEKDRDRERDRLSSKEKESRSSESKSQSVKIKTEPGYEVDKDKEKSRTSSREGKLSSDSKSSKGKTDSVGYENYSDRERSTHRENKTQDSKTEGTSSTVKVEPLTYENYDRSSSQRNSSGYSTVNSKPESGYDSYSTETDSSAKLKVKSDVKGEKCSSSSSRRDRDRERDEKGKDKKESKESPQERDRKERQREKDKEREKDNRKRKHNGELSDKEEQSSSKKSKESKESSESKKPKVEVEKSKPKKPKLVIRGEVDSTSGFNFADVLNCLDVSPMKSSSKKKDSKEKWSKKSVIVPPTSSKKDEVVSLVRKSDIDRLAAEKKKNRNKNGIIESIIAPTVNISPNYKPATNIAVLPKLPKPSSSLSLGSLGLNDPSNWEDSRSTLYEDNSKADALSTMMSSRNARTKVFSGNKAGIKGEVPKLFDLCMHVIQENIQDLGFTGGVPYDILKPALERATATQLYNIEDCNPYLIEDTDELWKFHCSRDFRGRLPQELESWRELYLRCVDEREARFQSLTVKMKKKVEVAEPIRKTKLAYVETHFGGPRFSKSKAATIKNGMKSLKFREEKGVKRAHGMSAMSGGSGTGPKGSSAGIVEEAAVIISSDSKAGSAPAPSVSREPTVAKMKPKKAPLMQKTFKLMKTLCRR